MRIRKRDRRRIAPQPRSQRRRWERKMGALAQAYGFPPGAWQPHPKDKLIIEPVLVNQDALGF